MNEQVITTKTVMTVGELRRALATVRDEMMLRDYVKRAGLQVSLIKTDLGDIVEVA